MAAPLSPDTTFVDDSTPAIDAATLNNLQTYLYSGLYSAQNSIKSLTIDGTGGASTGSPTSHIVVSGLTPTTAFGTGAGTGPILSSINGSDTCGVVNFATGTTPSANAAVITFTFKQAYAVAPIVVMTQANGLSAASFNVTSTTTTFALNAFAAFAGSTTFVFNYIVIGRG